MVTPNTVDSRPKTKKISHSTFLTPRSLRKSTGRAHSSSLLAKYAPSRKASSEEISHEDVYISKGTLKAYKSLLKTAIGKILIEIITIYMKKGVQPYTLNVSHLDLDKSPVIEEQDESTSPCKGDQE